MHININKNLDPSLKMMKETKSLGDAVLIPLVFWKDSSIILALPLKYLLDKDLTLDPTCGLSAIPIV